MKEVRELAMRISGGKSAGSRKSQCKGPEVGACLPSVFKEQRGGRCGWSREQEGERELDVAVEKTGAGSCRALSPTEGALVLTLRR